MNLEEKTQIYKNKNPKKSQKMGQENDSYSYVPPVKIEDEVKKVGSSKNLHSRHNSDELFNADVNFLGVN